MKNKCTGYGAAASRPSELPVKKKKRKNYVGMQIPLCKGNSPYIDKGKGDALAQRSRESPPQSYERESVDGDLEGFWKHLPGGPVAPEPGLPAYYIQAPMKLHLSPYNVSPSAWSLASITSASNTCCLPRVFTPRQHSTTPCLLRSAGSGSATLDVAPTTQTQQQYKQYQQQQQQQQWHLPTRSISERDTLDTHADFAAPNHEDDIDQLQLLQRELEGYRATTTRELAHLQQQDAEGTAGPSKRRASTSALSLRSSSSSSSSSTFSEPSTSSSSPAPISRKRLGARSRSTSTLQLGSPTSFASSTKRSQNRQQHHGQQPATATSPSTSSSNSALRNSRRALLGDVAQATPSADSVHSSERRARLLSRAEEVMLATVARDGVHIEKETAEDGYLAPQNKGAAQVC
eukprot:1150739-Pelagomonas_calceolata.AAC.6